MSPHAPAAHAACLPYLPIDRRQALARGEDLPERTEGAGLFADISGFTSLADALVQALGPRRGAEELTRQLDRVYGALIGEVDRYGGSVIGFSGDAITCWFTDDDGRRAVAAALAMQQAMRALEAVAIGPGSTVTLGLKVAISTGTARRFVVGDPAIQRIDVLAGALLDRLALTEQAAETGEVVLDDATAGELGLAPEVQSWREVGGQRYVLIAGLTTPVEPSPWPGPVTLGEELVHPWLLPTIYGKVRSGQAAFLADLRPVVALFLRFEGIDYEADPNAGSKLDGYVRWVQQIVARLEGTLVQVTIGDKGSYLYAAFGAPVAHDDDATRAVAAAMTLGAPPPELAYITPPRIGISQGRMWAGPYGGPTRRTYGVLGDEVNVAARLMQAAEPGQILVTQRVAEMTRGGFGFESLVPVLVKGKPEPVAIFAVQHQVLRPGGQTSQHGSVLPLVGRDYELGQLDRLLEEALTGTGRVVAIVGEAGVGKSRLVTEIVRRAIVRGFTAHVGEAQAYGANAVYLAWHTIWRGFFEVDEDAASDAQVRQAAASLERIDPAFAMRLPLLGAALNLAIPDNDLTRSIDVRRRKELLEALLVECVRVRARTTPLLFVVEDGHWLDPLSLDLVEALAPAVAGLPVLLVLANRPLDAVDAVPRLPLERVALLPHCRTVRLFDFSPDETARLIRLKLLQFGVDWDDLPATTVEQISTQAGGNPFHIEELLNYLHDRGLDPRDPATLERIELPESLHSLILSRVDHLDERQQVVLKVASVVGRQFAVRWLWGVYPDLGEPGVVRSDLDHLSRLDITPLDTPAPELRYLFKHVLTQEVVYESQPYGTRATLHENLGRYLEETFADRREQYLDLLAYHYGHSDNLEKQRQYYREAGAHAARRYASAQAANYFTRALALTPATDIEGRYALLLARMQVFRAQFAREAQRADLDALDDLAERLGDAQRVEVLTHRANYFMDVEGDFSSAVEVARHAVRLAGTGHPDAHLARAYLTWGGALFYHERYSEAREPLGIALDLARHVGARDIEARTINFLGVLAGDQGELSRASELFEHALQIYRALGDQAFEAMMLRDRGLMALYQWDFAFARDHFEQARRLAEATGNRRTLGGIPARFGDIAFCLGDFEVARALYEQSLQSSRDVMLIRYPVHALCHLGLIASLQGDHRRALEFGEEALALVQPRGQLRCQAYAMVTLGHAYLGLGRLDEAAQAYQRSTHIRQEIGQPHLAVESLAGLARVELARDDTSTALAHVDEILACLQTRSLDGTSERFRVPLTCYRVLAVVGDARAAEVLRQAVEQLQAFARTIDDARLRQTFLEDVPWHRELLAAAR